MWLWVLAACAIAYLTKLAGFLLPDWLFESPAVTKVSGGVTVGLLAALIALNTFGTSDGVVIDARLGALAVGIVGFAVRLPFVVVVLLGAVVAALLRLSGLAV